MCTCSHTIQGGIRQMFSEITSVYSLLDYTILFERAPLRSIREKHPQKCYQFSSLRQNYKQCDISMLYIVYSSLSWISRGLGWHLDTQVEKRKVKHDIYCIFKYKHQKLYMPMYITSLEYRPSVQRIRYIYGCTLRIFFCNALQIHDSSLGRGGQ